MSSGFREGLVAALLLASAPVTASELKVCADPNNLPFSNQSREGFENRIVELVAADVGATVDYVWWAQREGYITEALLTGRCDMVAGLSGGQGLLLTYPPYYRSTYAFVTRAGEPVVHSFDDPALRTRVVGVQLVGEGATPPAQALARRGITDNVRGYSIIGDYSQPNPPARIIDALARGDIDVAIAWGPLAGYFAQHEPVPLVVTPVEQQFDAGTPMAFDVAMAFRRDESTLRQAIEAALVRNKPQIDAVLRDYGVPRLDPVAESQP